jgi:hypothetical protein
MNPFKTPRSAGIALTAEMRSDRNAKCQTMSDSMKRKHCLIIWLLLSVSVSFPLVVQAADVIATPPAAQLLQAGDFIWPEKPGVFVPYNSRPGGANASDASL